MASWPRAAVDLAALLPADLPVVDFRVLEWVAVAMAMLQCAGAIAPPLSR